jgi:hypothetical protein
MFQTLASGVHDLPAVLLGIDHCVSIALVRSAMVVTARDAGPEVANQAGRILRQWAARIFCVRPGFGASMRASVTSSARRSATS